jgi:hypothetical protein
MKAWSSYDLLDNYSSITYLWQMIPLIYAAIFDLSSLCCQPCSRLGVAALSDNSPSSLALLWVQHYSTGS